MRRPITNPPSAPTHHRHRQPPTPRPIQVVKRPRSDQSPGHRRRLLFRTRRFYRDRPVDWGDQRNFRLRSPFKGAPAVKILGAAQNSRVRNFRSLCVCKSRRGSGFESLLATPNSDICDAGRKTSGFPPPSGAPRGATEGRKALNFAGDANRFRNIGLPRSLSRFACPSVVISFILVTISASGVRR